MEIHFLNFSHINCEREEESRGGRLVGCALRPPSGDLSVSWSSKLARTFDGVRNRIELSRAKG